MLVWNGDFSCKKSEETNGSIASASGSDWTSQGLATSLRKSLLHCNLSFILSFLSSLFFYVRRRQHERWEEQWDRRDWYSETQWNKIDLKKDWLFLIFFRWWLLSSIVLDLLFVEITAHPSTFQPQKLRDLHSVWRSLPDVNVTGSTKITDNRK